MLKAKRYIILKIQNKEKALKKYYTSRGDKNVYIDKYKYDILLFKISSQYNTVLKWIKVEVDQM